MSLRTVLCVCLLWAAGGLPSKLFTLRIQSASSRAMYVVNSTIPNLKRLSARNPVRRERHACHSHV